MRDIILEELKKIEESENVRIIMAVESGSRAWGFASVDSDYDVRFIYVRNEKEYLKLNEVRDVIEWKLDETLDINGWDLKKALQLLYKSNPTMFEWFSSPIVYRTSDEYGMIKDMILEYFSLKKSIYHYLHIAQRAYNEHINKESVNLKKYFYALRPLLACKWILEKKCPSPMLFSKLMEEELEEELKPFVLELLELKKKSTEDVFIPKVVCLNEYIDEKLFSYNALVNSMEDDYKSWDTLNEIFWKIVTCSNVE